MHRRVGVLTLRAMRRTRHGARRAGKDTIIPRFSSRVGVARKRRISLSLGLR